MREERAERAPTPAPRRKPLARKRERATGLTACEREHTNASAREEAIRRAIRDMSEMSDRFTAEET